MGVVLKVRKLAGTVGTIVCRNRYAMRMGGRSRGRWRVGLKIGSQARTATAKSRPWRVKWARSFVTMRATASGAWIATSATLKALKATTGWARRPRTPRRRGWPNVVSASQVGMPTSSSGGTA